jgi:hypothetical protein
MTPLQKRIPNVSRKVMVQKTMCLLHLYYPIVGEKCTKCCYENLWDWTAKPRSLTNPLLESFQAIRWKIYAEAKTKRIASNNTSGLFSSKRGESGILSKCEGIFPLLCRHTERPLQVALSLSVCFAPNTMMTPYIAGARSTSLQSSIGPGRLPREARSSSIGPALWRA